MNVAISLLLKKKSNAISNGHKWGATPFSFKLEVQLAKKVCFWCSSNSCSLASNNNKQYTFVVYSRDTTLQSWKAAK